MPDFAVSDDARVQRQLDRLTKLGPGADVLGLDRITRLLGRIGDPHERLPPVFHVAGTNGKGSTCAFLRAALEAAGHRVHVFTSPHLVRFNERIRLAGQLIEDAQLADLLAEVLDAGGDIGASFFEVTTAVAFLAFARTPADACIIEVGLGGRLDATNVLGAPAVCGIAQIGIDHEQFLLDPANGPAWPAIERIAWEKAGIAKPGVPLVVQDQAAWAAIRRIDDAARAAGAPMLLGGRDWRYRVKPDALHYRDHELLHLPLPAMAGAHQHHNLALAIAMLRHQQAIAVPDQALAAAAGANWPARLQRLAPGPLAGTRTIWVDGAHNPAAAQALADELARRPCHLILGILANKNADAMIGLLAPHALSLGFIAVPGHASHDPAALAARWGGRVVASLGEVVDVPAGDILIAGSLYLAGEALRRNGQIPE